MNLEDRLRQGLHSPMPADDEEFLGAVRRGASARRRRRTTGAVAACVLAVAGVAGIAIGVRAGNDAPEQPPATQTPTPTLPAGAFRGVLDVVAVSPDVVFRLTSNDGCAGCSTIWVQNDGSGWIRLHDFGAEAYDGGDPETREAVGPVEHFVMDPDGRNGWAWGQKLYSTHDGGTTWSEVGYGPGRRTDYGHAVVLTDEFAWSLFRSDADTQLFRTPIGADEWTEVDAPAAGHATEVISLGDTVALVASDEGLSNSRLVYSERLTWKTLTLPCSADYSVFTAGRTAFEVCPAGQNDGAALFRATADLDSWLAFGTGVRQQDSVYPLASDRVLLIHQNGKATLMTPDGNQPVDLSAAGESHSFFDYSSIGAVSYLVVNDEDPPVGRLLRSGDGGRTWTRVE